jgi:pimeloyl-ACP methyl ester carboxylesterase
MVSGVSHQEAHERRTVGRLKETIGVLLVAGCSFGCSTQLLPYDLEVPAVTMRAVGAPDVMDGRRRFREIFCTLLARENGLETGPLGCEKQLHRLVDEAPVVDPPTPLPAHDTRYRVLVVPGLFGECLADIATPFQVASARLRRLGYRVEPLIVSGRSSAEHNAGQIADAVRAIDLDPEDRLVLVGHSKGAVDLLHFLASHPDLVDRVEAVVSVAGAINGSPIANRMAKHYEHWAAGLDADQCPADDGGAIESLRRPVRLSWLAAHPLPPDVPRFSVVAFTEKGNSAHVLRPSWRDLARIDPRNDGQLLFFDQVIPGATLLGYANADHFAVAIPFDEQPGPVAAAMAVGHAPYPRGVLLEAIVLYVAERANGAVTDE